MKDGTLSYNLNSIKKKIRKYAVECRRDPDEIQLVAVSKNHTVEAINQAMESGQYSFGENRVQELLEKAGKISQNIEWHMIGHLQTNKVKVAVKHCKLIHSVDSLKLLRKINETAHSLNKVQSILIQTNISGESTKYGFTQDELIDNIPEILNLPHINWIGLMTMAPHSASINDIRHVFRSLRLLRDKISDSYYIPLPELSMGMTNDFKIAIEEGSTIVRIGSAIFGIRG